jgi:putative sterol carrier protein
MNTKTKYDSLADCLGHFQTTFNENGRVHKLVTNWNRHVVTEAIDTGETLTLLIQGQRIEQLLAGAHPDANEELTVYLQAQGETLIRIFSGEYNPSNALVDGELAIFSSEKDKVKLEAIAVVIWGL